MLALERFGDVTRVHLTSWRSRLVGYSVSAYLVDGVLVDTGFPGAQRDVARLLGELRPRGAIVTHAHEDHAGNVELIVARGIPLLMSAATHDAVRTVEPVALYRRFTWRTMPALASPVVPFDGGRLALLPLPGHSPDHHVVWDAERETLFGGDLFLGVKVRIAGHGEDPRLLARSVRQAAALRPARLFDAHRGLVPRPATALAAKADWLEETIGRIDRRIAEGWSDLAIRQDVLGGEEPVGYLSRGEYSRLGFVRAVRAGTGTSDPG